MSIETVFNGKVFTITHETVIDEHEIPHVIERCSRPDVVSVIGLKDHKVLLIKEFRQGAEKYVYWLPGGKVETGELPIDSAKREFQEETGFNVNNLELFHKKFPSDTFLGNGYVFITNDFEKALSTPAKSDEHGLIMPELVDINRAIEMTLTGEMPNEFFGYLLMKIKASI